MQAARLVVGPKSPRVAAPANETKEVQESTMNRLVQVDPAVAAGQTKALSDSVQARLSVVPNLFRVLGNSPASRSSAPRLLRFQLKP